jgi:hypothetical protein
MSRNQFSTGFTAAGGLGCLIILANLALVTAVIAVAWHFISKYW